MTSRSALVVGAAATTLLAVILARFAPADADKSRASAPPPAGTPVAARFLAGAGSCGGRACHGGSGPVQTVAHASGSDSNLIQQNEYSTWLARDKHADAYAALLSERGKRIGVNLNTIAHEDARCLACHANPLLAVPNLPPELVALRTEGVSCESCHGPANGSPAWFAAHTTAAWKQSPNRRAEFDTYHMTNITDPAVQARTCAGCHVGAAPDANSPVARDCNHDLMAAGHPRLDFELCVFRINQPPHWRVDKQKNEPAHEAKLWAVGQAVAARASLELLAHRAQESAGGGAPWPEFAETDCFTCHADIREKSWRQNAAYYKGRTPGSLPYSRWFSTMLPVLAPLDDKAEPELLAAFRNLGSSMSKPSASPGSIAEMARKAMPFVDKLVESVNAAKLDAAKVQAMLAKAKALKTQVKVFRWEQAEQLALALAALHQAELSLNNQPGDAKTDDLLVELFRALSFPAGYESPQNFRRDDALEKALDGLLGGP